MRLLIISQYFWPENFRINDLAAGLAERGHDVTVLTGLPNYPEGHVFPGYWNPRRWNESHEGVRIVRVPIVPRGNARSLPLTVNYMSFALSAAVLAPIRCRQKFDVIFVY